MTITYYKDAQGNVTLVDLATNSTGAVGNPATDIGYQAWLAAGNIPGLPPAPTLAQAQTSANAAIDAQAGATRLRYITDVPGQADTYTRKAADAAAYKAALYPFASIASYPWTQAEVEAINGVTFTAAQAQAAADGILATQAVWDAKGAAIELVRRAGKIAVGLASTAAQVQTAQASAIAALQAL